MDTAFSELKISCVTSGDGIFSRVKGKKAVKAAKKQEIAESAEKTPNEHKLSRDEAVLDGAALHVYKKIPIGEEVSIDDLPDSEVDMKSVMRALLKLEMGCFITMLPGERVKRNT